MEEEQSFLNDFLQNVSEIYHRPINNIMITLDTNVQIMTGGSTEPAYLLSITALPSEIAAAKNMRSAALIQNFLTQSLSIPQDRGVVRFQPIKEQDLATNGKTVTQEIEEAEKETGEERRGLGLRGRQANRPSKRSQLPTTSEAAGEMEGSHSETPILAGEEGGAKVRARKSIMSFFKR